MRLPFIWAASLFAVLCGGSAPSPAAAIMCAYKGPGNLGPLTVSVDEALKRVIVTTALRQTWTFQDGVTTRYRASDGDGDFGVQTEFVLFRADRIEVGLRDPEDGSITHMSYFNRSALATPPARCVWKSLWNFRRA